MGEEEGGGGGEDEDVGTEAVDGGALAAVAVGDVGGSERGRGGEGWEDGEEEARFFVWEDGVESYVAETRDEEGEGVVTGRGLVEGVGGEWEG